MSSNLEQKTARGLLEFASPQQTFDVGGVQVGGVPGISPTVMIGSVFYHGHKVNTDEDRGEFDRDGAKKAIEHQDEFSELTGNPCMLDVVGATPDAIVKHLEFAAQVSECPLLIDGTTDEVRLAGLKYVAEAGLADRVVYNSIQPETSDEELQAISDAGVEAAILLAYYLKDFSAKGRVLAVEELLPRAHEAGIRSLMVDTCVLDLATMGQASGAMFDVDLQTDDTTTLDGLIEQITSAAEGALPSDDYLGMFRVLINDDQDALELRDTTFEKGPFGWPLTPTETFAVTALNESEALAGLGLAELRDVDGKKTRHAGTPINGRFALLDSTELSTLNRGATGVQTADGDDLKVTARDGTTFTVDLTATTMGEVRAALHTAAGAAGLVVPGEGVDDETVTFRVGLTDDRTGLKIEDKTGGAGELKVESQSGSLAAQGLGIAGMGEDGTIEGT
ncbi:MAG: hypothetical protein QGH33_03620, partial [Pirellulaceae bacterium]|nr:hypothetical protein [Pirellulaceae bacterium]